MSKLPLQKGLEILGGWVFSKDRKFKKCIKLNWNFQQGEGFLKKIPFCGGRYGYLWNYTFPLKKSLAVEVDLERGPYWKEGTKLNHYGKLWRKKLFNRHTYTLKIDLGKYSCPKQIIPTPPSKVK